MKTTITIVTAIFLAAAIADTSDAQSTTIWPGDNIDTTRPNGIECPSDQVTCILMSTTRFECSSGDALLCWFGKYRPNGSDAKPPINEGW